MDADYQGQWRSVRLTPETRVVHTIRADAMRGALTALAIALASGEVGNAAVVTLGLKTGPARPVAGMTARGCNTAVQRAARYNSRSLGRLMSTP